jgi:hypothetical protein
VTAACASAPLPVATPAPRPAATGQSFSLLGPTATPTFGPSRPSPPAALLPSPTPTGRVALPGASAIPTRLPLGSVGGGPSPTPTIGLPRVALPTLPSLPTIPRLSPASPTPLPPAAIGRAVAPAGRTTCPDTHPIKGVITTTDRIYLVRTDPSYPEAVPSQCFTAELDAQQLGYRRVR